MTTSKPIGELAEDVEVEDLVLFHLANSGLRVGFCYREDGRYFYFSDGDHNNRTNNPGGEGSANSKWKMNYKNGAILGEGDSVSEEELRINCGYVAVRYEILRRA